MKRWVLLLLRFPVLLADDLSLFLTSLSASSSALLLRDSWSAEFLTRTSSVEPCPDADGQSKHELTFCTQKGIKDHVFYESEKSAALVQALRWENHIVLWKASLSWLIPLISIQWRRLYFASNCQLMSSLFMSSRSISLHTVEERVSWSPNIQMWRAFLTSPWRGYLKRNGQIDHMLARLLMDMIRY